jgi:hypothetical protein
MRYFIYVMLISLFTQAGIAQVFQYQSCGGYIAPYATVVTSALDTTGGGGTTVWVCTGGNAQLHRFGGSQIYIESGGKVFLDRYTGGSTIYMKKGAVLEAENLTRHNIYYEAGAIYPPGAHAYLCKAMDFDYTYAPENGCMVLARHADPELETGQGSNSFGHPAESIKVSTDPEGVYLHFYNPLGESYRLELFDIRGRMVKAMDDIVSEQVRIGKADLQPGLYFFRLQQPSGKWHQGKFVMN